MANETKITGLTVLSLFDGISCAREALVRAGIPVEEYYASEIDKYAIQVSSKNYPDIKRLGSVKEVRVRDAEHEELHSSCLGRNWKFDLLIGGSPCQDLSIAKKDRKGLEGEKSGLFFEYVRILNEVRPKFFILENVASMSKESKDKISEILGIQPVMINASLVSAQNRKRLFWVGRLGGSIDHVYGKYYQVEIPQPEDLHIYLKDILEDGTADRLKSYCIDANYHKGSNWEQYKTKGRRQLIKVGQYNTGGQGDRIYSPEGKSVALSALGGGRGAKTGLYAIPVALRNRGEGKKPEYNNTDKANSLTTVQTDSMVEENMQIRKLTPIECERLQGLSDNFTEGVSNTQRYKMLGNAFNVDVVAHILKHLNI